MRSRICSYVSIALNPSRVVVMYFTALSISNLNHFFPESSDDDEDDEDDDGFQLRDSRQVLVQRRGTVHFTDDVPILA